jgi:hypothetical protein
MIASCDQPALKTSFSGPAEMNTPWKCDDSEKSKAGQAFSTIKEEVAGKTAEAAGEAGALRKIN